MNRVLPPEVDKVKNWCLATRRFEEANFIILVKERMRDNKKITPDQAMKLGNILQAYALDNDLLEKIRERVRWAKWP